jgi:hypothetical protein
MSESVTIGTTEFYGCTPTCKCGGAIRYDHNVDVVDMDGDKVGEWEVFRCDRCGTDYTSTRIVGNVAYDHT